MTDVTPAVDGVISLGEYHSERRYPSLTYSKNKEQFDTPDDHDEYGDWDFDFYLKWDKENVYMAWVVKTDVHKPLPESEIVPEESLNDGEVYLGNMWKHSFVHILITPGAPLAGKTKYKNGNYLELGVCQLENGSTGKAIWNLPRGITDEDVSSDNWCAAVSRNDERGETIYEVSISERLLGVSNLDLDTKFGLAFAVGAQENYDEKKGIIEWNDAILGTKAPDNAGVVHLSKIYVDPVPDYPIPTPNLSEIPADESIGETSNKPESKPSHSETDNVNSYDSDIDESVEESKGETSVATMVLIILIILLITSAIIIPIVLIVKKNKK